MSYSETLKKLYSLVLWLFVLLIIVAIACDGNAEAGTIKILVPDPEPEIHIYIEHRQYYYLLSTVCLVDEYSDSVVVVDVFGEMWEFIGAEDWQIGDWCRLTMYDSGIIHWKWDDSIIQTIYCGVNPDYE